MPLSFPNIYIEIFLDEKTSWICPQIQVGFAPQSHSLYIMTSQAAHSKDKRKK